MILTHGKLTGGSLLTRKKAIQHDEPVVHFDMDKLSVDDNGVETLNVAGSRASKNALIYGRTFMVLDAVILND